MTNKSVMVLLVNEIYVCLSYICENVIFLMYMAGQILVNDRATPTSKMDM